MTGKAIEGDIFLKGRWFNTTKGARQGKGEGGGSEQFKSVQVKQPNGTDLWKDR